MPSLFAAWHRTTRVPIKFLRAHSFFLFVPAAILLMFSLETHVIIYNISLFLLLDIYRKVNTIVLMSINYNKIVVGAISLPILLLCSCGKKVEGRWTGVCHNGTYDSTAPLTITFQQDGGQLKGVLMLGGEELVGSGPLTGCITGKDIVFTTQGDNVTYNSINWQGSLDGNSISGTYRIEPTPEAVFNGLPVQQGTFSVSK